METKLLDFINKKYFQETSPQTSPRRLHNFPLEPSPAAKFKNFPLEGNVNIQNKHKRNFLKKIRQISQFSLQFYHKN
jgi:hypothetical protein